MTRAASDILLPLAQVSYLLEYGELPSKTELSRWDDALRRHSALPVSVSGNPSYRQSA